MSNRTLIIFALVGLFSCLPQRGIAQNSPPVHGGDWPIQNGIKHQPTRGEVEAVLASHFGRPVPLRLVLDDATVPGGPSPGPVEQSPEDPADYDLVALANQFLGQVGHDAFRPAVQPGWDALEERGDLCDSHGVIPVSAALGWSMGQPLRRLLTRDWGSPRRSFSK